MYPPVEVVWRVDVRVNPVDPPGALRRLGRRKLELGSLEESRRRGSILVDPPKPAAFPGLVMGTAS
jgi:hypothetical protein